MQVEAGAGVAGGAELVAFTTAAVTHAADLDTAREALRSAVGDAGLVEAAGTVAAFEGLNRIADATGIQLDDNLAADSVDFRAELGIEDFSVTDGKVRTASEAARAESVLHLFQ